METKESSGICPLGCHRNLQFRKSGNAFFEDASSKTFCLWAGAIPVEDFNCFQHQFFHSHSARSETRRGLDQHCFVFQHEIVEGRGKRMERGGEEEGEGVGEVFHETIKRCYDPC